LESFATPNSPENVTDIFPMYFETIEKIVSITEEILLSFILTAMILLSCLQIFLRLFFDGGLNWADPLLRHMVVWGGLLGALLAVSQHKHISIDISDYLLSKRIKKIADLFIMIISSIVCGVLCYASWGFLQSEIEFGSTTLLNIPSWGWISIFPAAFGLMSFRYLAGASFLSYRYLIRRNSPEGFTPQ